MVSTQAGLAAMFWLSRDLVAMPMSSVFRPTRCLSGPPALSALEAAAIPVNYFTAWQLIVVMGGLKPKETVLIHSAGGGVGIAAIQISKHIGATVIGTASEGKHRELRAFGVDHLIDYRREDFEARARAITGGRGVELILDAIGGESLRKGYRLLAPTGRLGMFGISSAATGKQRNLLGIVSTLARTPWLQFNPVSLMNSNKGVFGVNLGHMWNEVDRIRSRADQVLDLASRGVLKPRIAHAFPFEEAADAHSYIQDRRNIGKVLSHTLNCSRQRYCLWRAPT